MHPKTRNRLFVVGIVVIVLLGLRFSVLRGFDSTRWKSLDDTQDWRHSDSRKWMAVDLVLLKGLKGKSREQMIELLGPPSKKHKLKGYELVYSLGRAPVSLKRAWLAFKFKSGVVADWDYVRSST